MKFNVNKAILFLFFFLLILSPGEIYGFKLIYVNVTFLIVIPLLYMYCENIKIKIGSSLIALLCYLSLQILVIFYYSFQNGFYLENFIQLNKPLLFLSSAVLGYLVGFNVENKYLISTIISLHFLILIISIFQLLEVPAFFNMYSLRNDEMISESYIGNRIIGPIGNPNLFGLFQSSFLVFFIFSYLQNKKRYYLMLSLSSAICVLFTQSRTGLIGLLLLLLLFILINLKNKKIIKFTIITFISLIFTFYLITMSSKFQYIFSGFNTVAESGIESQSSFAFRLVIWETYYPDIIKKPFLGSGPKLENSEFNFADNNYILIVHRFGIVGLVLYLSSIFSMIRISNLNIRNESLNALSFSLWFLLLFSSVTMDSLESIKLTPFTFFITFINYGRTTRQKY